MCICTFTATNILSVEFVLFFRVPSLIQRIRLRVSSETSCALPGLLVPPTADLPNFCFRQVKGIILLFLSSIICIRSELYDDIYTMHRFSWNNQPISALFYLSIYTALHDFILLHATFYLFILLLPFFHLSVYIYINNHRLIPYTPAMYYNSTCAVHIPYVIVDRPTLPVTTARVL